MEPPKQKGPPTPKMMFEMRRELEGTTFPPFIQPHCLANVKNFEVREDDVVLATYPKCGTHWMMEVIQLIKTDGHVDQIERENDRRAIGCIEFTIFPEMKEAIVDVVDKKPSPRMYGTHLPATLLPAQIWTKKPKVVYVTRNPKDAANSFYNFMNADSKTQDDRIGWDEFCSVFMSEKAIFGNWFDHTLSYWSHRDDENVFFITFEEMKKHGRDDKTYAKIEKEHELGELLTKAHGKLPFLKKGIVGGWKARFTVAQSEAMDKVLKERLSGTGLEHHYN
ncbi:putative sulfotransferase 1C2 [Apostichopus japonicus]|uniref:Putative sulfotransferase 1C2 n=1 Tax=Stichopus japonicus TaxID=307972 RepID=A0A2G8K2C2_STIJA|nr:putative sulfotransferase 1C2 [Apostichopus japonicus]